MITTEIDGLELTPPARYASHATFLAGGREAYWSDDRDAVLAAFASQVARDDADFVMTFDFLDVREIKLFIAEFDRPRREADGRPIQRSYEEIRRSSNEVIDRVIERTEMGGLARDL